MKQTKHRTLKLALIFSLIIFFIMVVSSGLIGIVITIIYYTNHSGTLDMMIYLLWAVLPSLITGTVITFLFALKVLNPVLKACDAIVRVAEGDFTVRFQEKHSIYEINHLAECFNFMVKKLDDMNTLHNDFIDNASHEFRTPLSVIKGYAGLLLDENITDNECVEYANHIIRVTGSLSATINNILFFSQVTFEDIEIEKKPFCLSESIREVLILSEDEWSKKNISFDLELQDFLYSGNREMLKEVWNNLIGNAIKFSDNDGKIRITASRSKKTAVIVVSDEGIGMTEETLEKIFDKFFQAETSHSQDGVGLGLSIVKRIVDLHQGKILVDSEIGCGSTFTVYLPV